MDPAARLEAIEGIRIAKARHQRGVDTGDSGLLRRAFAEDVEIDVRGADAGTMDGARSRAEADAVIHGVDEAVAATMKAIDGNVRVHHLGVPEVEICSPTTGHAIWPQADRRWFDAGASPQELAGYGHYYETYVRTGDDWRIKTRRLVRTRVDVVPGEQQRGVQGPPGCSPHELNP